MKQRSLQLKIDRNKAFCIHQNWQEYFYKKIKWFYNLWIEPITIAECQL